MVVRLFYFNIVVAVTVVYLCLHERGIKSDGREKKNV